MAKKKDFKLHIFDLCIYPLIVCITENPTDEKIKEYLEECDGDEISPMNDIGIEIMSVYDKICRMKSDKKYCVLINTRPGKWSVYDISHEATHAARFIWDWLGESPTGREADAYLVGYIADHIDQVRTGKFK